YRPLEILADIELLRERGYTADVIIQKTGLSPKYVRDIVFLLEQGEERLIEKRQQLGPSSPNAVQIKPPTSSECVGFGGSSRG
ncbi:MAG: hypothetical protein NWS28_01535, partial [Limnohabitans sp.]|nr:hypothetical protein [Limnohabitans sp.]